MPLNYVLKDIEERKAIDVGILIYSPLFFNVLNITESYYNIKSLEDFINLLNSADFTEIDANLTSTEKYVQSLNYDYLYPTDKTNLRTIDYYLNFIIECLHYNYNIILINCSSTDYNFTSANQYYSFAFCIYDPLKTTISETVKNEIKNTKIPFIFNASLKEASFESPDKKFYIDKNVTNIDLNFSDFYNRSEINDDDFRQMAFTVAGVKRIKRYYGDDNNLDDSEYSNSPYILISLVADASGIISRKYSKNGWESAAGLLNGKILNQKFTKINLPNIKYTEAILPSTPTDLSFRSGSELDIITDRRINVFLELSGDNGKEYYLATYYSGVTSTLTPALESFSFSSLLSIIKKQLDPILLRYAFSSNNTSTRDFVKAEVEIVLDSLNKRGAIKKYSVVCDETNNKSTTINDRKLIVDISLNPTQFGNTINLIFNT